MASDAPTVDNVEFGQRKRGRGSASRWSWFSGVALALAVLYLYPGAETFKSSSLLGRSPASARRPVEIEARLGRNLFGRGGEEASLDISVLNRGDAALSGMVFCVEAPGFHVDAAANCSWSQRSRLQSMQRITRRLTLTSLPHSGLSSITVHVYWTSDGGPVPGGPDSGSVVLGPIRLDPPFGAFRWNRFGRRLSQVFKDLTLPLLLFFLTSQFTARQNEKEARDRAAETARAEERNRITQEIERESQETQQAREEKNQVRRLLLERVMNLAQMYYMPIVANAVSVLREGVKVQDGAAGASVEKVLFYCLSLLQTFERLRKDKGGLFLKSLQAEYLISYGWILVKEKLNRVLTEEQIDLALNEPRILESYAAFKLKKRRFALATERLEAWLHEDAGNRGSGAGFGSYVGGLDIIQAVLRHEINVPFWDQWYDDKKETLGWDFQRAVTEFPAEGDLSQAQKVAVEYLKANLNVYRSREIQRIGVAI